VTTWNIAGTHDGAPYSGAPFWWQQLIAALYLRDGAVSGEGNDEIINWSSLCVDVETGEVVTARIDFDPLPFEGEGGIPLLN